MQRQTQRRRHVDETEIRLSGLWHSVVIGIRRDNADRRRGAHRRGRLRGGRLRESGLGCDEHDEGEHGDCHAGAEDGGHRVGHGGLEDGAHPAHAAQEEGHRAEQ